jgi:hypothetical protein
MPTITIDLPDNLNVPSDWDVQSFLTAKMYEAGFLTYDHAVESISEPSPDNTAVNSITVNSDSESWFTPEQRAQFKENRRRLDEEAARNPRSKEDREKLHRILLNFPVADEEDIKRQDEVREHMRQWKLPEY